MSEIAETLPAFSWPGLYPMYYINHENQVFCPDCANKRLHGELIGEVNWENTDLCCDDCGKRIASVYKEDSQC